MSEVTYQLVFKLPWWWRFYFWAIVFFEWTVGGVDPEKVADFVVKHSKFTTQPVRRVKPGSSDA
ncbi:hypothetical protein [Roseibium sp. RKSG952]|uniref:hypothetical protein n=1 Tax=Roseibium sp. RKSG952 TaxID=2529384 RepID=UPI0012BBB3B7|nr:hypothetical protein [Roseibium sp. RKSG952]MTH96646.1 hypothetical protein [Roseibium sp. RKSG952]